MSTMTYTGFHHVIPGETREPAPPDRYKYFIFFYKVFINGLKPV
ncbi:hypothetical protein DCCM_3876 [Desulfocucumis palustris]|uniref:Uncharacterized protein n=1 Tax=Desulfocucumis palustris TaxID=1898651 RepID=A0A2L2XKE3_9FIRM|nr:hypothetical protein DCCM_3876 [Desulfocucumis palustris]